MISEARKVKSTHRAACWQRHAGDGAFEHDVPDSRRQPDSRFRNVSAVCYGPSAVGDTRAPDLARLSCSWSGVYHLVHASAWRCGSLEADHAGPHVVAPRCSRGPHGHVARRTGDSLWWSTVQLVGAAEGMRAHRWRRPSQNRARVRETVLAACGPGVGFCRSGPRRSEGVGLFSLFCVFAALVRPQRPRSSPALRFAVLHKIRAPLSGFAVYPVMAVSARFGIFTSARACVCNRFQIPPPIPFPSASVLPCDDARGPPPTFRSLRISLRCSRGHRFGPSRFESHSRSPHGASGGVPSSGRRGPFPKPSPPASVRRTPPPPVRPDLKCAKRCCLGHRARCPPGDLLQSPRSPPRALPPSLSFPRPHCARFARFKLLRPPPSTCSIISKLRDPVQSEQSGHVDFRRGRGA